MGEFLIWGIILLFTGILLYLMFSTKNPEVTSSRKNRYTDKLLVDLELCEIYNAGYTEEKERANIFNTSIFDSDLYNPSNSSTFHELTYIKFVHNGKRYIGGPITVDSITIKHALLQKKYTYIYYSKANPGDYYFDLEFITTS